MGRRFEIPEKYRSSSIATIKRQRKDQDPRKKDFSPTVLDLGKIKFKIARHFGFCYGVENAIEIAYRALEENPGKRVFLLSEMIHNPHVNSDLQQRGVKFILSPSGEQLIAFEELRPDDVVIVPAFGTTVELFDKLSGLGIDPLKYNATCPFVEKVWKRSEQLGEQGYTVIIHGKNVHEETRATFSHAKVNAPSLVILNMEEAAVLEKHLLGQATSAEFFEHFLGRYSPGFDPDRDLMRIGVVNQTTMLATETLAISDRLKFAMQKRHGAENLKEHFADTRDTLCYATWDNQEAVKGLIATGGDLALVVGGYNSSNTSHLVELCEEQLPTYYVKDASEILSLDTIRHYLWRECKVIETRSWLPIDRPTIEILVTAGASCPDRLVDEVLYKVASFLEVSLQLDGALAT